MENINKLDVYEFIEQAQGVTSFLSLSWEQKEQDSLGHEVYRSYCSTDQSDIHLYVKVSVYLLLLLEGRQPFYLGEVEKYLRANKQLYQEELSRVLPAIAFNEMMVDGVHKGIIYNLFWGKCLWRELLRDFARFQFAKALEANLSKGKEGGKTKL